MPRQSSRLRCFVISGLLYFAFSPQLQAGNYDFDVLLNDKIIGEHTFSINEGSKGIETVQGSADYRVRFLGIEVFRYQHQHEERWEDGCLSYYSARTDTRGGFTRVAVEATPEQYVITTASTSETHLRQDVPCLWSYAYWRPEFKHQTMLMNGQTGALSQVTMTAIPASSRPLPKSEVEELLKLDAQDSSLNVLFDPSGKWIGLEVELPSNRRLTYRLRQ